MTQLRYEEYMRPFITPSSLPSELKQAYCMDESECVSMLLAQECLDGSQRNRIRGLAFELASDAREKNQGQVGIETFLHQYSLGSHEGVVLMCLAEALLRIPDEATAAELIHDKLAGADWETHLGQSESLLVNASTWGLLLTGKIVNLKSTDDSKSIFQSMLQKFSEPMLVKAVNQAMGIIGSQFIAGNSIENAIKNNQAEIKEGYSHSFDMLGEAAVCQADADRYFQAYLTSINTLGEQNTEFGQYEISIKLSALHPRYEYTNKETLLVELTDKLKILVSAARNHNIPITIDAEESYRLELSLLIFEQVFHDSICDGWPHFGLAVQAYQKRAFHVIKYLTTLAKNRKQRIPVRLVKGAYWDTEIKRAQQLGFADYPVFTRKANTDLSYLNCATELFRQGEHLYPQFAGHNAHTITSIIELSTQNSSVDFEFQRLHGMGKAMFDVVKKRFPKIHCRIYAPVGEYNRLLPYLVRRLLENGANTSFIYHFNDPDVSIDRLVADPIKKASALNILETARTKRPYELFDDFRQNSRGLNLDSEDKLQELLHKITPYLQTRANVTPLVVNELNLADEPFYTTSPANNQQVVASLQFANKETCFSALETSLLYVNEWQQSDPHHRAYLLEQTAELFQEHRDELITLCMLEAGKTYINARDEVREAIDFCYYYAALGREQLTKPEDLSGPTGESNKLYKHGRGVFLCISPWNFPLAIFTGQIAAALMTGNTVIAKAATTTSAIAHRAVELMHQAEIPKQAIQFLPVSSQFFSQCLIEDSRIAGIAFTGSTQAAHSINQTLAARNAPIIPLIAETGGQNALIADSSALPEQLVTDVVQSAFDSCGQRCSALRVLFIQNDCADHIIELLAGAIAELKVGHPLDPATDIGPVISREAQTVLTEHIEGMLQKGAQLVATAPEPKNTDIKSGYYVSPTALEIPSLSILTGEVFGPILHIVRFELDELDDVIAQINNTGFGLTLGIHSRIESRIHRIQQNVRAGNVYVNRNMIGATVGVQPFGGQGFSGTGPKAGGPNYLHRFVAEKTISVNTAAIGGDTQLMSKADVLER